MTPVGGQSQHTGRDFENNERVARDMGDGDWTILANGDWLSKDAVITTCSGSKNVIACDGALETCNSIGVVPTVVVGDLDSASPASVVAFAQQGGLVHRDESQNCNDLEKALEYAKEQGATSCTVFGATGGDVQHEWANLSACGAAGFDITCLAPKATFRFFRTGKKYSIEMAAGQTFSLFALGEAKGITLQGAKFSLDDASLAFGSQGVHNIAQASQVELVYSSGRLMMVHPVFSSPEGGV